VMAARDHYGRESYGTLQRNECFPAQSNQKVSLSVPRSGKNPRMASVYHVPAVWQSLFTRTFECDFNPSWGSDISLLVKRTIFKRKENWQKMHWI
jgi:hypothetical protein